MKWFLTDPGGWIVNTIWWDGETDYNPPLTIVPYVAGLDIGWNYLTGAAPPEPEPEA